MIPRHPKYDKIVTNYSHNFGSYDKGERQKGNGKRITRFHNVFT